jgi:hypothetical protein
MLNAKPAAEAAQDIASLVAVADMQKHIFQYHRVQLLLLQ